MYYSLPEYITSIVVLAIIVFLLYKKSLDFKETDYYKCTKKPWLSTFFLGKGSKGEYLTYKYLKSIQGHKRFLFNCYVPKENDETTEIDVIMIHETGIHVFESKNYSGWIFGNESSYKWTQVLPKGRGRSEKSHFLNPIIQNKGHIKWLKSLLNEDSIPFFSYIVFSERCALKDVTINSLDQKVINRYSINKAVNSTIDSNLLTLTDEKIDSLFNQLYPLTQADAELISKHIQQIKENSHLDDSYKNHSPEMIEKDLQVNNDVCPRCGGKLILRTARKGYNAGKSFYGCSNYPKCKYIKNLD